MLQFTSVFIFQMFCEILILNETINLLFNRSEKSLGFTAAGRLFYIACFRSNPKSDADPRVFMCFNKHGADIRSYIPLYKRQHDVKH